MVVLPVPRGPQNKYAWERRPSATACSRVETICCWPTTLSNVSGRYFLYSDSIRRLLYGVSGTDTQATRLQPVFDKTTIDLL